MHAEDTLLLQFTAKPDTSICKSECPACQGAMHTIRLMTLVTRSEPANGYINARDTLQVRQGTRRVGREAKHVGREAKQEGRQAASAASRGAKQVIPVDCRLLVIIIGFCCDAGSHFEALQMQWRKRLGRGRCSAAQGRLFVKRTRQQQALLY